MENRERSFNLNKGGGNSMHFLEKINNDLWFFNGVQFHLVIIANVMERWWRQCAHLWLTIAVFSEDRKIYIQHEIRLPSQTFSSSQTTVTVLIQISLTAGKVNMFTRTVKSSCGYTSTWGGTIFPISGNVRTGPLHHTLKGSASWYYIEKWAG